MGPLITLTTDFGLADAYAGAMKGVILDINPRATVVDISHRVEAQDVAHGAFVLGTAYRHFPRGTIHVAVVDPGVGTQRRALVVQTPREAFILPDNGLLTFVLRDAGARPAGPEETPLLALASVAVPRGWRAYVLTNPRFWRHPVSATFHGRDVFAPTAAHLSLGVPPQELGEPVDNLVCLHLPEPRWCGRLLVGHVVRVDGFGNLITTLPAALLPRDARIEVAGRVIGLSQTYGAGPGLTALEGSHGYVEIALPRGSAARLLGCGVGEVVRVQRS